MEFAYSLLLVVHILVGLAVIGLVLLQHGKGADMGAAFGGGASGSLFGATGSANFLSRTTAVLATMFFLTSLGLSYISNSRPVSSGSVIDKISVKSDSPSPPPSPTEVPDTSSAKNIPK